MLRLTLSVFVLIAAAVPAAGANSIAWQPWSEAVFARAEREHRFVLLDLEAVWCHWCHVMNATTYADPKVVELIGARYIAVRVDQDSRPDISRRYENYGWPATVVFDAAGGEIVKRRGYLAPPRMTSMLQAIIADPSPIRYRHNEPVSQFAVSPLLSTQTRQQLERQFYATHDGVLGAFKQSQKFLDRDSVEYGLLRAAQGDARAAQMTRQTLDGALQLIDPAWGGAYQYSTDGDWNHPHYEKIMAVQAENLRLYALAYAQFHEPRYLHAAQAIPGFVKRFLTNPAGGFYTSQDADLIQGEHSADYFALDDAARCKLGIPAVDTNSYARENGWMIQALATLYSVTGDSRYLDDARAAAGWVLAHRSLSGGGFKHGETDSAGPYLEDTLAMGRAFVALYAASADRAWLAQAQRSAAFIEAHFRNSTQPGYASSAAGSSKLKPATSTDENVLMARFANLLYRYTGAQQYRASAAHAMRLLATPQVALARLTDPGILQASFELANDPTHITVVGAKDDPLATELFHAALGVPAIYRRIEWWDRREGPMPNPDVQYPSLVRAAVFVCADGACSLPLFQTHELLSSLAPSPGRN